MPADSWKLAPGVNHVGAYQVSGRPFASASCLAPASGGAGGSAITLRVQFPQVTRWFQIIPSGAATVPHSLRVGFSKHGVSDPPAAGGAADGLRGGNYFKLYVPHFSGPAAVEGASSTLAAQRYEMKVSELHFMSDDGATVTFDIVAGLTNIPSSRLETDDGPNYSGSRGVG